MKRSTSIFAVLFFLCGLTAEGADLSISNNAIVCFFGDSWNYDPDPSASTNIAGFRMEAYVHSYLALNYPQYSLFFYNWSRSGGTMDDMLTNRLQRLGLPVWGYQSNNFQHIGIACMTDNGGLDSNGMYLAMSNVFQAPRIMSDGGTALNSQSGWASTATVQWIGLGEPPLEGPGPDTAQRDRNDATTNAGPRLGLRGIDIWNPLSQSWTNDYIANGGTNIQWFSAPKAGHFASGGALSWALAILKSITTDTNISTCIADWAGSVVSTNHCVLSGVSQSGNTLTFNRLDDRLPMAWDVPDGTITNNATTAFNLAPGDANYFQFTLQITNLPVGNYIVKIDGATVAVLPQAVLAGGWNMFTNYTGPYWAQRKEVLGLIRDLEYVNRVTLIPGSAGDQLGLVALGSNLDTQWGLGKRGDDLIAAGNAKVAQVNTNSAFSFAAIRAAAQPTNHTFTITLAAPIFAPFHK